MSEIVRLAFDEYAALLKLATMSDAELAELNEPDRTPDEDRYHIPIERPLERKDFTGEQAFRRALLQIAQRYARDSAVPHEPDPDEHALVLAGWRHPDLRPVSIGPLLRAALARPTREFADD